jgi:putative holliday junction resolvase
MSNKGKIIGIDYGTKRCGLAITDSLQLIAAPLKTVETTRIFDELAQLIAKESAVCVVVGEARYLNGDASDTTRRQADFCMQLQKKFPQLPLHRVDEMYTSQLAQQSMLLSGAKKKDRAQKGNIDMISAAILLQSYLDQPH